MKDSIDPFDDMIRRTERGDPPFIVFFGMAIIGAFALFVFAALWSWSYNECLEVGHSEEYCNARAAGCVR